MDKNARQITSIQALRGAAAILVVFCHSLQFLAPIVTISMYRYFGEGFGNFGVDIFFVISGFIMVYISTEQFKRPRATYTFLLNRIKRIYPIYIIATLFVMFIIIPSGLYAYALPLSEHFVVHESHNISYVIKSLLLIPYFDGSGNKLNPIIGPGWTLIYEAFFYLLFSFTLFFKRKYYLKFLFIIFIMLFAISNIMNHLYSLNHIPLLPYITLYGNNIIFEFLYGCIIAECYLAGRMLARGPAKLLFILSILGLIAAYHVPQTSIRTLHGITLVYAIYHVKALGTGVSAALLVYTLLSLEKIRAIPIPEFLVKLGNASYSIYLTHFSIFLVLCLGIIKKINAYYPLSGDCMVIIIWLLSVMLGYQVYHYIEQPVIKFIKLLSHRENNFLAISIK